MMSVEPKDESSTIPWQSTTFDELDINNVHQVKGYSISFFRQGSVTEPLWTDFVQPSVKIRPITLTKSNILP